MTNTFRQPAQTGITTVVLVRHAEKKFESGNPDPDLTQAGQRRAQNLADVFAPVAFDAAIATRFRRAQQTAKPICDKQGLALTTLSASDSHALARHILDNHAGGTVLVVGHSNTVPVIMQALGVENPPRLTEDDYGDVFIITIAPGAGGDEHNRAATMLNLKINPGEGPPHP